MTYRFLPVVALSLLLSLVARAEGTDNQERSPADLLKEFIETPPMIADLIYECEVHDLNGDAAFSMTNYIRLRYQSNAVFFGKSEYPLLALDDLDAYGKVVTSFENKFWYKYNTDLYGWTNHNIPAEQRNIVDWHYRDTINLEVARVLNMGCDQAPVGTIRWRGDMFLLTNRAGFCLEGRLRIDNQERATSLSVEKRTLRKGLHDAPDEVLHYEYSYARPLKVAFMPSTIIMTPQNRDQKAGVSLCWRINILDLKLAETPLLENAFSLIPYRGDRVKNTFAVSNRYLLFSRAGETHAVRDSQHDLGKGRRQTIRRIYFAVVIGLICGGPLILFALRRRPLLVKTAADAR